MYLPAVSLPDISFDCSNEEIFKFLEKMSHGHPLPPNAIADVNPYNYAPSNLPDGIWFLIRSKENEGIENGFWKVKGEACKLFSNSMITGWMTALEFFEGQVPYERKTDWVMQDYWITHKGLGENSKAKDISSLCRVFLGGEQGMDHQKQQKMPSLRVTTEIPIQSTELASSKAQNASSSSSANKSTVEKDDETRNLTVTGEPANHAVQMSPDNDYFSRGDYLELLDLDDPGSPSSSSDNSSCVTMSSDECFDSLALLQELDSEINQDLVHKDAANCKFNISTPFTPNEVVMAPAPPGSFIGIKTPSEEEIVGNHSSLPALPDDDDDDDDDKKDINRPITGTETSASSIAGTSQNGGMRKKKLKKKYLCFMPFHFLL